MKIIVAIDSLKGSLTSLEAGAAAREGILSALPAAQETLQKLAEQSELTFELIAVVDNKLNASLTETNAKINNVYSMTIKLFSAMKAKVQTQEEQIKELNWIVDLKNHKYHGVSYKKLDDVQKLVCAVRDCFEVSRRPYNFNRLETALDNLGLSNDRNRILFEDFIWEVAADNNLYEHLFAGTSQFATENEVLAFALKCVSEGKNFEHADKERIISCYDLAVELLYNLDKLKYAEKLHKKLQDAKKLFLNYKIKDALPLLEELEDAGKVEARYMLGIIYRRGFAVEKNFDKARELITQNISAGDVSSIDLFGNINICYNSIGDRNFFAHYRDGRTIADIANEYNLADATTCDIIHLVEKTLVEDGRFNLPSKIPKKASKKHPLSKEDRYYNRIVSKMRIAVEHAIRFIKRFRMFSARYRSRLKAFEMRFNLICAICNFNSQF